MTDNGRAHRFTSRQARVWVIGAVVALVATGCTDSSTTQTPADIGHEPQDVRIVAVDYDYPEAPEEIEAGVVNLRFENQGTVAHEVGLAGIGDTPLEQFVQDLAPGIPGLEDLPFPGYLDQVAVPPFVGTEAGTEAKATFTLTEGRYALFCAYTDVAKGDERAPHFQLGMIRALTVSGGDAVPQLPEADGTLTATDDALEADIEAGDRTLAFINEGPAQVHYASIEIYPEGVDATEAEEAFKARLEPGPAPKGLPVTEGSLGFTGIFSAGLGSAFELDRAFESGRTYLFACSLRDREGGEPHTIAYDQYEIVTIE